MDEPSASIRVASVARSPGRGPTGRSARHPPDDAGAEESGCSTAVGVGCADGVGVDGSVGVAAGASAPHAANAKAALAAASVRSIRPYGAPMLIADVMLADLGGGRVAEGDEMRGDDEPVVVAEARVARHKRNAGVVGRIQRKVVGVDEIGRADEVEVVALA